MKNKRITAGLYILLGGLIAARVITNNINAGQWDALSVALVVLAPILLVAGFKDLLKQ